MQKFLKAIDRLNTWFGEITAYFIYFGMIVISFEVVMRYFLRAPTLWGTGVAQRIFVLYFFLSGGYVLLRGKHINMDVLYAKLSVRTRAILDLITGVLTLGFAACVTWYGSIFAWQSLRMLERDNTAWQGPLYPFHLAVPVAAVLLLLQAVAKFIRDFSLAIGGAEK